MLSTLATFHQRKNDVSFNERIHHLEREESGICAGQTNDKAPEGAIQLSNRHRYCCNLTYNIISYRNIGKRLTQHNNGLWTTGVNSLV